MCDTWEHTRCAGIRDEDPVPSTWSCSRCITKAKAVPNNFIDNNKNNKNNDNTSVSLAAKKRKLR